MALGDNKKSMKELCKRKNILRSTGEALSAEYKNLKSTEDQIRFVLAVIAVGKHKAHSKFFVVVGRGGEHYPVAKMHEDKAWFVAANGNIEALVYEGNLINIDISHSRYLFKADDGKYYESITFVEFRE